MARSRSRLAADWFAKLRQNETTGVVEHIDVAAVESEVNTTVSTQIASLQSTVDAISVTPADVSDQANTSTGYFDIPVGTTAQRPTADWGQLRLNSDAYALEVSMDGAWSSFGSLRDGSSAAKAIEYGTSLDKVYSDFGYTGQQRLYVMDSNNTPVETYCTQVNGKTWVLVAAIGDGSDGAIVRSQWWNKGRWSGTSTMGTLDDTYMWADYKNSLYHSNSYSNIMVMQGYSSSPNRDDWYNSAADVAYTNNNFLDSRGNSLQQFLSGTNGPNVATNGNSGNTTIPLVFDKGSAASSRSRYYSSSQGELSATNVFQFGVQNNEGYRYTMCNALGCQVNGVNTEHTCWSSDIDCNYNNQNAPGFNFSGTSWGLNRAYPVLWHLIWVDKVGG